MLEILDIKQSEAEVGIRLNERLSDSQPSENAPGLLHRGVLPRRLKRGGAAAISDSGARDHGGPHGTGAGREHVGFGGTEIERRTKVRKERLSR